MAVLLFILAGQAAAQDVVLDTLQAVLAEVRGKVEVLPPGAAEWIPAEAGMVLEADSVVSTAYRSSAVIQTGSSRILLQPQSRLTLEEIVALEEGRGESLRLFLRAGRVRADILPPVGGGSTEFTVRSPMAVASVRGTSFEFDTVNLLVDRGLIRYSYINGITVYVAGLEKSYADDQARRVASAQELAAGSRIPQIPLYTGPGGAPIVGDPAGLVLTPAWIP
jgi:hypothetical protein